MDSAIETSSSTSNSIINSIQTFPRPGRKKRTGFFQIYELPRIRYRGPSNKLNELSLVSKNGDYDVKDYDRKNAIRSSIVPNSTVHELSDVIFDLEATHLHEAVNNYLSAGSERISSALESAGPYEIDMVQVWRTVFIHSFVGRAQRDSQTATNSTKIVATSDDTTSTTTYAKSHDALQRLWKLLKQRKTTTFKEEDQVLDKFEQFLKVRDLKSDSEYHDIFLDTYFQTRELLEAKLLNGRRHCNTCTCEQ
jgi:hypothetical protein